VRDDEISGMTRGSRAEILRGESSASTGTPPPQDDIGIGPGLGFVLWRVVRRYGAGLNERGRPSSIGSILWVG
jgi:hypothetical protein